ncbi:MAG: class I SAM-dependent methyltransferase [Gammaproteobacteria bacterium]|jgi:SAM-dependent methyltransferase|nr:class I SAM-dependent methyltransferase [Gammaproteobacteria bacterium]
MSDFSDAWLALRAPADTAARADELVQRLAGLAPAADGPLQVLDLGCGSGANLRHLAPLLAAVGHRRQQWTCVDHDPALLARLPAGTGEWAGAAGLACRETDDGLQLAAGGWEAVVATRRLDLAGDLRALPVPAGGLVTGSALLDLVSASWLDTLLARCRTNGCALLFTLSYDGRCTVSPAHGEDARVVGLVNRHQRTDKGFGPALGPAAAERAAARCRALGWRVEMAPSDWVLGTEAPDLQQALLAGWRDAAAEMAASSGAALPASRLDAWLTARCGWVAAGRSWLRVGHQDLLALP